MFFIFIFDLVCFSLEMGKILYFFPITNAPHKNGEISITCFDFHSCFSLAMGKYCICFFFRSRVLPIKIMKLSLFDFRSCFYPKMFFFSTSSASHKNVGLQVTGFLLSVFSSECRYCSHFILP